MSITIKKLDKPNLPTVKMMCDDIIDEKLTKYPMLNDVWSRSSYNIICGSMGAGKTSLITNLVKHCFKKCFHSIYLIMPETSRSSMQNDIFGKYLPDNHLFDNLDEDILINIYEKMKEDSKDGYYSLLIIDDYQAQLKDKNIIKILQKIITKMRHLRCTIFLLQQTFQALAKPLRELASNLILFDLGKSQLGKIFDEVIKMDKDKYEKLIQICFKDPHDWVLVNLNRSKNIYRNFDLVIIND